MKKLIIKRLRIFSSVVLACLVLVVGVFAFSSQKVVSIVGTESETPIYYGNRNKPQVGLMFNVYEGSEVVLEILKVLSSYNAKATFFVGGVWAEKNGEIIEKIFEAGHEIGNHGYFHLDHKKLSLNENVTEISACHQMVKSLVGVEMNLFAPPSGSFSSNTLLSAEKLGYKTIMWTLDTIDWRDKSWEIVYNRATKKVEWGNLILMHPKTHTLKALDKILEFYKERGITAVTVSQCIETDDSKV